LELPVPGTSYGIDDGIGSFRGLRAHAKYTAKLGVCLAASGLRRHSSVEWPPAVVATAVLL
jgi:hypothetical protein